MLACALIPLLLAGTETTHIRTRLGPDDVGRLVEAQDARLRMGAP